MVVFHVSTFILQLHLAGGFDYEKMKIFILGGRFFDLMSFKKYEEGTPPEK